MDVEKDNGRSGLRESEVALDLTRLKNWSNFEETAYRDFSQQRAERRSIAHRRLDEGRRAGTPVAEGAAGEQSAVVPVEVPPMPPVAGRATDAPAANGPRTAGVPTPVATLAPAVSVQKPAAEVLPTPQSAPVSQPVPVRAAGTVLRTAVAVYSLAGGVGKSTICAHLARALYSRGERVLLVDSTGQGMLSTYFGASEEREGLRKFCAPGETHASVLVMSREQPDAAWLGSDIVPMMESVDRTVFEVGSASGLLVDEALTLCQVVLVPVVPGPQAMLATARIAGRLEAMRQKGLACPRVFYLLNRFNKESEQQQALLQTLESHFGDAIVPIQLESSEEIEYAFAERMTINDFHTTAPLALQYEKLAGWLRKVLPASTPAVARRWSEV